MPCNCQTARTSHSGGNPITIREFTQDYTLHFEYSNWDVYSIFTCNNCDWTWFIQNDHVDRPPYISSAQQISKQKLGYFISWNKENLDRIISQKGIRVLNDIVNGILTPDT